MAGLDVDRRLRAAVLACVAFGSVAIGAEAFAQPGSTGGSIGKTGKSQSGSDEAPAIRREPSGRKPARPSAPVATSSCAKMPGSWSWFNGITVVIRSNGTAAGGRYTATWSCKNDGVIMHWSHGYTDRLQLSQDGTHLSGTNGYITVSGDKR